MSYPYLIQGDNMVVVIDGKSFTVSKSHINYEKVKASIISGDWDAVKALVDPVAEILNYGNGNVSIKGHELLWKGKKMDNTLTDKMVKMYQEGFPIQPLVLFMENLMKNPSFRAVNELYSFLEKGQLPITSDGYFLAYKKVKQDFMDVHSGTVPNKVAGQFTEEELQTLPLTCGKRDEVTVRIDNGVTVVEMERNFVNDDKEKTCAEGLHFCSKDYLGNFWGNQILVLKINPADVVSIPVDYGRTKGRTARYQILATLSDQNEDIFTKIVA